MLPECCTTCVSSFSELRTRNGVGWHAQGRKPHREIKLDAPKCYFLSQVLIFLREKSPLGQHTACFRHSKEIASRP